MKLVIELDNAFTPTREFVELFIRDAMDTYREIQSENFRLNVSSIEVVE